MDEILNTRRWKIMAYIASLSLLGSLIMTYFGTSYRVVKEMNPVANILFEIHYLLPAVLELTIILGISIPAYKIDSIEESVYFYATMVSFLLVFINFLRELILLLRL